MKENKKPREKKPLSERYVVRATSIHPEIDDRAKKYLGEKHISRSALYQLAVDKYLESQGY